MSVGFYLAIVGIVGVVWFGVLTLKFVSSRPVWGALDERQTGVASAGAGVHEHKPQEQDVVLNDGATREPTKELWEDSNYCWVVVCKNHWFHRHPNIFNVHRIPLGETDAVSSQPPIQRTFAVRCDECGKVYLYKPSAVMRYEMEVPKSFVPHPFFRD